MRLGDDAVGQHARRFRPIRHLSRDKNETVGFDRMTERGDRLRAAGDHVKFQDIVLTLQHGLVIEYALKQDSTKPFLDGERFQQMSACYKTGNGCK